MKCKNCNGIARKNFCSTCGQHTGVGKINYKSVVQELFQAVFFIKNGFLFTLKELFLRPGSTIRAYLDGQRKRYFKPVVYVIILSSFYYLSVHLIGENTWLENVVAGMMEDVDNTVAISIDGGKVVVPELFIWLSKNYSYLILLSVPLFSLASWIAFWHFKVNYFEHFVINLYITGQQAFISTIILLINASFKSDLLEFLSSFLAVLYVYFVYWKFFKSGRRFWNVVRTIISYMIYTFLSFIIFALIFILNNFTKISLELQ